MPIETAPRYRSIWQHLQRTAFRQDFVEAGGIRTRYVQAGNPRHPPVVMLHGTAGTWEAFCATLAAHAEHFNCFALDMAGNGFSDKPDVPYEIPFYVRHLKDFMVAVGVHKASFIGVSLGAWVAARFALTHPALTEKLVLIAAAGMIANPATMQKIRAERSKAAGSPTWDSVKAIFANLIHDPHNRIDDLVALRLVSYGLPGAAKAMDNILVLQDAEVRSRNLIPERDWRRIEAPALLIGAIDHPDDYLETARRAAKLMPRARYVEMRGVNHWAQFEDPDTFNRLSIDFLRERP